MRYLNWVRIRATRLLLILFAIIVFCFLLYVGSLHYFPGNGTTSAKLAKFWFTFGSSSLIALIFLAVGSLVWLFARDRRIALLIFCCSFTMMTTFAVETGSVLGPNFSFSNFVSDTSSLLSLALFAIFLTLFPRNYFAQVPSRDKRYYLLRGYLVVVSLLCVITVLAVIPYYQRLPFSGTFYHSSTNVYVLFVLVGIIVTIILSYKGLPTLRQRQQVRLFVGGVVLAFAPFLLLTIMPGVLPLPANVAVDGQTSTLPAIFLPLALGYSILRYQILVFDMHIRRIVTWLVGAVGLIVLGYLVVAFTSVVPALNPAVYVAIAAFCLVVLAPLMWWLARVITERLFFNEIRHYRHFIEKPAQLARETFDMHEAAELLTLALVQAFEIDEVCLYVLDQESGYYQLTPDLDTSDQRDAARQRLAHLLLEARQSVDRATSAQEDGSTLQEIGRLSERLPLLSNVNNFKRPLLLSEANRPEGELPTGLARYLLISETVENDPLLVAVRAQGKMIALLVMGSRSDGQPYAGPDFEAIDLILAQFASLLETARLYQQAHRDALALRDAYERLKELDKLKDQFIMTASHELRTPLTAVQGYIELLQNYNDRLGAEERAAFIAKAQRGCDELTLMVGNIMDASRVEVDVQEVTVAPVPLADSVSHVLEIMEGVTRREKRHVELAIADDVVVEADELRLRQIILNLVGNALKYSAVGSPLEISASIENQMVTLGIRDYGRGVPPRDQARLFERFVRLERDMNSPVRGAGLGLAISKQLVEAMGGRIWVESSGEEGEGSVFAFSLKCGQAVRVPAS